MSDSHKTLTIEKLAIFGGTPTFSYPIHVSRPYAEGYEKFIAHVDAAWGSRWFTNDGPLATKLERQLEEYLGVQHCVLTSSGTSGMSILINALELSSEVIMPSFTFVSTAHALRLTGVKPVFCDIGESDWQTDVGHCESLITDRTSAIIATHLWGRACNVDALEQLCAERGVSLIFDAAHAFNCTHQGKRIAGFGDAEVFSFHATKVFHTFEGGAITTNNEDLAKRLRLLRNFGFCDYDCVEMVGTNAKMNEISAAMGLAGLETLNARVERCKSVYHQYLDLLKDVNGICFYQYDVNEKTNFHYVVVEILPEFGLTRDQLTSVLQAENVLVRRYFYPGIDRLEPYVSDTPLSYELPNTRRVASRVLVLPGGADITDEEIINVCNLIKYIALNVIRISEKLED